MTKNTQEGGQTFAIWTSLVQKKLLLKKNLVQKPVPEPAFEN
jgi:hypothetical protein